VLSSKTPAGRTTAPDAELFAIRLDVSKATSMNIKHIISITGTKRIGQYKMGNWSNNNLILRS